MTVKQESLTSWALCIFLCLK